jgi:hypothetical protein
MVMRVFVAGGAGFIGRRLLPKLVPRGHQVTATTTSAVESGLLAQLGAGGVVMDGLDAVSVGEAVAGLRPDAIVHQMTAISAALAGKPDSHAGDGRRGRHRARRSSSVGCCCRRPPASSPGAFGFPAVCKALPGALGRTRTCDLLIRSGPLRAETGPGASRLAQEKGVGVRYGSSQIPPERARIPSRGWYGRWYRDMRPHGDFRATYSVSLGPSSDPVPQPPTRRAQRTRHSIRRAAILAKSPRISTTTVAAATTLSLMASFPLTQRSAASWRY